MNKLIIAILQSLKGDPYQVLGVSKDASPADIKKSYYQLAKQYHPDTNKDPKAKEKFVEIQSAYEILSDESKKAQYDQFGSSAFNDNGGGFNPNGHPGFSGFGKGFSEDIFDQLFSAFGGSQRASGGMAMGQDVTVSFKIDFMEAAKGASKPLVYERIIECTPCKGSGLKAGAKRTTCVVCKGTGQTIFQRGGLLMSSTCTACKGQGVQTPRNSNCQSCDGQGRVREKKSVVVDIPAGVDDGSRIRLSNQGHAPLEGKGPSGDLYVVLKVSIIIITFKVLSHPQFKRQGSSILSTVSIPLSTALLGGVVRIPTIDGDVDLTLPAGVQPEEVRVLRKRGVVLPRSRSDKGDHRVTIKIEIPKSLTQKQKELIIEAFGHKKASDGDNSEKSGGKKSGFFDFFKSSCSETEKEKMSGKSSS